METDKLSMTNRWHGLSTPESPVMINAAQSRCRGDVMTMASLRAFKRCHNTTLLRGDLVLNLSQYFTQWDEIAEVGALLYP